MPKCPNCRNSVRSYELISVGNTVTCAVCYGTGEDSMAEKKQVVSVTLAEVTTPDKVIDHEIAVEGSYRGLEVKFATTFDELRDFFTQRREKGKRAAIRSVK